MSFDQIKDQFNKRTDVMRRSIKEAEDLLKEHKTSEAKDILRAQIVFLDSILDLYFHKVIEFGIECIVKEDYPYTDKLYGIKLTLRKAEYLYSLEDDDDKFSEALNNIVSDIYGYYSLVFPDKLKNVFNLLDENLFDDLAKKVYPKSKKASYDLCNFLAEFQQRRNRIAHQDDIIDNNREDIDASKVKYYLNTVIKIETKMNEIISEKGL